MFSPRFWMSKLRLRRRDLSQFTQAAAPGFQPPGSPSPGGAPSTLFSSKTPSSELPPLKTQLGQSSQRAGDLPLPEPWGPLEALQIKLPLTSASHPWGRTVARKSRAQRLSAVTREPCDLGQGR